MKDIAKTPKRKLGNRGFIPLTMAPAVLVLGAFTFYPSIYSFILSMFKTRLFSPIEFTGFTHYISVLTSPLFWQGVWNTIVYSLFSIVGGLALGLLLAILLNTKLRGKAFFRTVFFAPYIIPMAAHTVLWYWLLDPRYGLINLMLSWIGISAVPWLTSRTWVIPAFILMDIWKRAGFNMVLFSSGLSTVPEDLQDAARVDGANAWQRFLHVTFPLLRPITLFSVIMAFLHTSQLFVEPFVMTKGGPGNASTSVVYQIYQEGFRTMNAGKASAMAVVLFLLVVLFTFIVMRKFDIKEM